jgi:hypothetical protein
MMLGTVRPAPAFSGPFLIWGQTYAPHSGAFVPRLLQACSDHRKIGGGVGTKHRF